MHVQPWPDAAPAQMTILLALLYLALTPRNLSGCFCRELGLTEAQRSIANGHILFGYS